MNAEPATRLRQTLEQLGKAAAVKRIAEAVGFGDAGNVRRAFIRIYSS